MLFAMLHLMALAFVSFVIIGLMLAFLWDVLVGDDED